MAGEVVAHLKHAVRNEDGLLVKPTGRVEGEWPVPDLVNVPEPPILPAPESVTSPFADTVTSFAVTSEGMEIVTASAIVTYNFRRTKESTSISLRPIQLTMIKIARFQTADFR